MAVTNTGIVLRTITGVNESDLFLDSEATSVATNTGIVERSIVGVHDANFVHPVGDELVVGGGFDDASNWNLGTGWSVSDGKAVAVSGTASKLRQTSTLNGETCKVTLTVSDYLSGLLKVDFGSTSSISITSNGDYVFYGTYDQSNIDAFKSADFEGSIDNLSVKEVLVNRESTTTNTGIVERSLTGVNESDLWLDSESTSVVNNTGIVERPITGVNESDPMFPDNTTSTVTNI